MNVPIDREPEGPQAKPSARPLGIATDPPAGAGPVPIHAYSAPQQGDPLWMLMGPEGLRAGWSILLFAVLVFLFVNIFGNFASLALTNGLHIQLAAGTAASSAVSESEWVMALAASLAILARIERRRFLDYNLAGPAAVARFAGGLVSGFAALSGLVGVMAWGGWIRFGAPPQYQPVALRHAAVWAVAFLMVALTEEGTFRCFLQYTLARSINFWWALAVVGSMCVWDFTQPSTHGAGGVYAMAALGVFPCLFLQLKKSSQTGFWNAAWTGSTAFGFIHTANNGETWIGILAAGAIGFVFCVSVRLTGSAWWAIGCHAAWDWAETYFYGTADSGFAARGHLFTTSPAGSALWSGGTDGPEGSLLVLPIILLLLFALLLLYGRKPKELTAVPVAENGSG
jgi:uncharacterized protein